MSLSAYTDGNRFLDNDKISFSDATSYAIDVTAADRLITTVLSDVVGADAGLWNITPTGGQIATPPIVIDISGMLAASYYYRRLYSEETSDVPYYADQLEARALMLLDHIRSGQLTLGDTYTLGTDMSQANFWPNDTTVDLCGNPIRFFTMQDCY